MGRLVVLAVLSVGMLAPPSLAAEPPVVYPEVAGTTVVHADGVTGIILWLPEPARITANDLEIELEEGTKFSWNGFRDPNTFPGFCDLCFKNVASHQPESGTDPGYATCRDDDENDVGCSYDAGPVELYMASDGPVTLTVKFRNLQGSTELIATGEVDGALKRLAVRGCDPAPDCDSGFSYGGEALEIGLGGRAAMGAVIGYVRDRPGPMGLTIHPGVRNFEVCAYPGLFGGMDTSGDPAAHPRGCDEEAIPAPHATTGGAGKNDVNWRAHGKQYLGFSVWNRWTFEDSVMGFWGMWLEAGMDCPSQDFTECDRPD